MSFRRRTYPEIMENVLTGLTGGIAAESHAYPPAGGKSAPFEHALENQPVDSIISVYGMRNNQPFGFVKEQDYQLKNNKLVWGETGNVPDAGSVFHVNYRVKGVVSPFNDLHVGSVVRTLAESFSLEMAGLYAQAEAVYKAGYIDTAEKRSLDNVVSLLGIKRVIAGRNLTKVKFTRSPNSVGDIFIPTGTRLANVDASIQYETVETVTLLNGQNNVQVRARDVADNIEGLEANTLILLTKPIAGIEAVTNPAPSEVLEQDESDEQLRTRSKNFLHGSEKATLGAIKHAIALQNITADVTENDPSPGFINIAVHTDNLTPEMESRLRTAIRDVRPAGIKITFVQAAAPYNLDIVIRIASAEDLLEQDLRFIQQQAVTQITNYIGQLELGEIISTNKIIGMVMNNNGILDVKLLSASVGSDDVLDRDNSVIDTSAITGVSPGDKVSIKAGVINLIDPALATKLSVKVNYPISQATPSEKQITAALQSAVESINNINDSELGGSATPEEQRQRELLYGKFLAATPLPSQPAVVSYLDVAGSETGSLPTTTDAGDYEVQFLITSESGVSFILESETSPMVSLIPFERLTFGGVQLKAKAEEPA